MLSLLQNMEILGIDLMTYCEITLSYTIILDNLEETRKCLELNVT